MQRWDSLAKASSHTRERRGSACRSCCIAAQAWLDWRCDCAALPDTLSGSEIILEQRAYQTLAATIARGQTISGWATELCSWVTEDCRATLLQMS